MVPLFLLFIISICTTVGAHLLFKKGVLGLGELNFSFSEIFSLIWQIVQNIWILTGAFLFVISFLIWLFIISKLQLNIAYPIIIGSEVVLVSLASWFLFKEYLSFFQILGILFVVLGIFLLSSKA
ncbi:MAG: EamA family transporter [Candidatus Nealsonbacteria bacterium]|nr:EamA family transporter [Candidatus Nealsonbacteria bacterium]